MSQELEQKKPEPRSRKRQEASSPPPTSSAKMILVSAGIALAVLAAVVGGVYLQMGKKYNTVFFAKTTINGLDASGKSLDEVKALIDSGVDGYQLTIEQRDGKQEVLHKETIGLHTVFDGSLETILSAQDPKRWFLENGKEKDHQISTMIDYDKEKLSQALKELDCMDTQKAKSPENARISEYVSGVGYEIIPKVEGNLTDEIKVQAAMEEAITNLKTTISLEESDCYVKPEIDETNPQLLGKRDQLNKYTATRITYEFGGEQEILDGDVIHTWLEEDASGKVSVDQQAVTTYVSELAAKYNTYNKAKTLKTSYGTTVKITGGTYGWKMNQVEEAAQLTALIEAGARENRQPVYSQKAASHGGTDYGDTYVEINLTAQHLFFYKNGSLLVESDFVSGNLSKGWGTPAGAFPLTYKQRDATLKGEDYKTPVSYWMPFNGGIGMHDAYWRSSFGGNIYKTSGSHGCVNLPPSVAKTIYENISAGMPVLCYELSGTEKGSSTNKEPETTAPAETTALAETTAPTEVTLPATETTAAPAQPEPTSPASTEPATSQPQVAETTAPAPPAADTTKKTDGPGGSEETTYSQGPGNPR